MVVGLSICNAAVFFLFFYSSFAISLLPSPPESRRRRCDGRADGKAEGVQEETFVSVLSLANI